MDSRVKKIGNVRVRASSLVEVTTAIVVISMVFSLAIMIYLNVQKSGLTAQRMAGVYKIDDVLTETIKTGMYQSRQVSFDTHTVYQDVAVSPDVPGLLVVRLEARDENGKVVAERKRLFYVHAE